MRLFGLGQVKGEPPVDELLKRLTALESAMRLLETEQITIHDQVRKWMRRAIAAERTVERAADRQQGGLHERSGKAPTRPLRAVDIRRALNKGLTPDELRQTFEETDAAGEPRTVNGAAEE